MAETVYSGSFGRSSEEAMKLNFRRIWQSSLIVAILMLVIGIAIDEGEVERYIDRMDRYMADGDYASALQVGIESDKSNARLTQLRVEALAHEHLLGERLFSYPVRGAGASLVAKGGDYELCAYLIDKNLDKFADALSKYYPAGKPLPRYYREALVLYNHLRSSPSVVYHDNVLDTDYRDLQELERRHRSWNARRMAVFQNYEGTYWYYYEYENRQK